MGLYRVTARAQPQVINTPRGHGGRAGGALRYCLDSPVHASTDGNTSQVRVALPVMASLSILRLGVEADDVERYSSLGVHSLISPVGRHAFSLASVCRLEQLEMMGDRLRRGCHGGR